MTRQTVAAEVRLVQVRDNPKVRAAQEVVDALAERRAGLEATHAETWAKVSPVAIQTPTEEVVLKARIALAALEDQLRLYRLDEIAAERALNAAQVDAREELRQAGHEGLKPLVRELDRALAAAAEANEKVNEIENLLSVPPDLRLRWMELLPTTPLSPSRIDAWRSYVRAAGLLT